MTQGQEEGRENPIQPIRASVFHSSPNLKVLRDQCSEALHILDRFHIMMKMNQALDDVRAEESRRVPREGHEPVLKKSRWLLLKREQNLTSDQRFRFPVIVACMLRRFLRLSGTNTVDAERLSKPLLLGRMSFDRSRRFVSPNSVPLRFT
jgi:transposase